MDKWCMKWNEFDTNIRGCLKIIKEDHRFFDVTLITDDGQHIQAHKIILSAGSHFFNDIFLKSNQANMLIYLKGIHSVQLVNLLDFIYNGEASVGQEELKEFLETGKELQVKGFEAYVAGVGESGEEKSAQGDPVRYLDEKDDRGNALEPSLEQHYGSEVSFRNTTEGKIQINAHSDLDLQILEMIEKSVGVWKCKVCGKTSISKNDMRRHAETHIEGMSHVCHICNKSFPIRNRLRNHIDKIHTELLSCDLCGRSGMTKGAYYDHKKTRQHKTLAGTL